MVCTPDSAVTAEFPEGDLTKKTTHELLGRLFLGHFLRGGSSQGQVVQLLAGTDAGTGVRGDVGVWGGGGFWCSAPQYGRGLGGDRRDTHRNTHRNVHANVAPTLGKTYLRWPRAVACFTA